MTTPVRPPEDDRIHPRRHPAHGVLYEPGKPIIVFLTVCTKDRVPMLASAENHELLVSVWKQATAWYVGRYVIMRDHLHLFASPGDMPIELDNWVTYWKSQFSRRLEDAGFRWQTDHWDRRLRRSESYDQKSQYVFDNPVRHGLVQKAEEWPYRGEIFRLEW